MRCYERNILWRRLWANNDQIEKLITGQWLPLNRTSLINIINLLFYKLLTALWPVVWTSNLLWMILLFYGVLLQKLGGRNYWLIIDKQKVDRFVYLSCQMPKSDPNRSENDSKLVCTCRYVYFTMALKFQNDRWRFQFSFNNYAGPISDCTEL
jgi:hypothetical protein